jgi:hypothetical protein
LGDLFSQHRGIVDFVHSRVAGDSLRGIKGILDRPATELLAPDAIFEHFSSRIAEYSSFYIYPSQIIPHFDEKIELVLDDEDDRTLCRRLVRILVLFAIHPTASAPTASMLAELVCCMVSFQDTDTNAQYVAEVLLDPLVEQSRFLTRTAAPSGIASESTYAITTSEDQGKILRMRIERVMKEIDWTDSRLISGPLSELPESFSWPGPAMWNNTVERTLTWRQSTRKAAVCYVSPGTGESAEKKICASLEEGSIDFALVISTDQIEMNAPYTAAWVINCEDQDQALFKEYFACRTVAGDLRSRNPADMPLIPQVTEQIARLEPAVRQALITLIYQGSFTDTALNCCLRTGIPVLRRLHPGVFLRVCDCTKGFLRSLCVREVLACAMHVHWV